MVAVATSYPVLPSQWPLASTGKGAQAAWPFSHVDLTIL